MYKDYEYLIDLHHIPEFEKDRYLKINGIEIIPEYQAYFSFDN